MAIIRKDNCIKGQFRQGDVLLEEVSEPITELARKEPSERGAVIALGEMTGHAHLVDPATAYEFEGKSNRPELGNRFLQTQAAPTLPELRHEGIGEPGDHETIPLKANTRYRIRQQIEFNPAGMPLVVRD